MNQTGNEFPETENLNQEQEKETPPATEPSTNLQQTTPYLLHIQTGEPITLPDNQPAITLGKPNNSSPPDVDLSQLRDSEIISRQHAKIHIETDTYYIEDLGSSNGTYVNNDSVPKGERYEIASGDVIALGKEDKVTFIFKLP
ncbi:MAG: FHA domain-containing protein [Halothece sp.]|jgi:pSer/pThr/pTyr-binding forkhead associated (FHA) protein